MDILQLLMQVRKQHRLFVVSELSVQSPMRNYVFLGMMLHH